MRVPGYYLEARPNRYQIGLATVESGVRLIGNIELGDHTYLSAPAEINGKDSLVEIGSHCDFAANVTINTGDSHRLCTGHEPTVERKPIKIGNRVFVGDGAKIFGGVEIGDGSVIGAGVVLKNVKVLPYSLVVNEKPRIFQSYYAAPRMSCQD